MQFCVRMCIGCAYTCVCVCVTNQTAGHVSLWYKAIPFSWKQMIHTGNSNMCDCGLPCRYVWVYMHLHCIQKLAICGFARKESWRTFQSVLSGNVIPAVLTDRRQDGSAVGRGLKQLRLWQTQHSLCVRVSFCESYNQKAVKTDSGIGDINLIKLTDGYVWYLI